MAVLALWATKQPGPEQNVGEERCDESLVPIHCEQRPTQAADQEGTKVEAVFR